METGLFPHEWGRAQHASTGLFKSSSNVIHQNVKGQTEVVGDNFVGTGGRWARQAGKRSLSLWKMCPTDTGQRIDLAPLTLENDRWYCIETHEVMNTPGVADGISEAWVDGVKVITNTDVGWQRAGSDLSGMNSLFRQNGAGNFWWDRFAAGNTRIGCLGATSATDTTRPAPPQGLVIR